MKRILLIFLLPLLLPGCYIIKHQEALVPKSLEDNSTKIKMKWPDFSFFDSDSERSVGPYVLSNFKKSSLDKNRDRLKLGKLYGYEKIEYEQTFGFQLTSKERINPMDWTVYCRYTRYEKSAGILFIETDSNFRQAVRCDLKSTEFGMYQFSFHRFNQFNFRKHYDNKLDSNLTISIHPSYVVKQYGERDGKEIIEVERTDELSGFYFNGVKGEEYGVMSIVSRATLWLVNGKNTPEQGLTAALSYCIMFYQDKFETKQAKYY
ncbi:MAG: hypothetical protein HWE27_04025 [Gammaproteobacteria bacterium]|nr:hypothetical protein [Gammaproteobacteria bacterium]